MDWTRSRSEKLYEQACTIMPGGVNSPVRSFKGMGTAPAFIKSGRGAYLIDEDGHDYVYMAFAERVGETPYGTFPNAR